MATRGKRMEPEFLAYVAGVLDSDGWIGMNRTNRTVALANQRRVSVRYQPQITVVNTYRPILEDFHEAFGGSISTRKKDKPHHKDIHYWRIGDRNAAEVCRLVLPYLRAKRAQAELCLEWATTARNPAPGRGAKLSTEELAYRESIYLRYKGLNDDRGFHSQPQRLSETASRTDEAIV